MPLRSASSLSASGETDVLDLHHELEHVARSPAPETFIKLVPGMHRKRRGLLVVERAQARVAGNAGLPQPHVFPDHLDNIDRGLELLFEVHHPYACLIIAKPNGQIKDRATLNPPPPSATPRATGSPDRSASSPRAFRPDRQAAERHVGG
jgi:hypothetical protein